MADGDGVTDVVDLSGNGMGAALNVFPFMHIPVVSDAVLATTILADGVLVYASTSERLRVGDGVTLGGNPLARTTDTPVIPNLANMIMGAVDRNAVAALNTAEVTKVILLEQNSSGLFNWIAGDFSALVTADVNEGIYIASDANPTGDAGAWVRSFTGDVDPRWFGVLTSNTGAQNDAAMSALFATLRARSSVLGVFYLATEPIKFPQGLFNFNSTIELTDGIWIIEGVGSLDDTGTILKFPSGVTGIRVQRYNTTGASGTRAAARGSDASQIRNLVLDGAYTNTEAEAHGIQLRARAVIQNVTISDFEGDGVYIAATAGGALEGNANLFRCDSLRLIRNRDGINVGDAAATADVNAGVIIHCDASSNRRWGFNDQSFLGNTYDGCHSANNGVTSGGSPSACVNFGGNRYGVISGQEVGASTNAPTGTTANNTWWYWISAGGVHANFPNWVSGTTYRAGGGYSALNGNARNVFSGCYHESGQGLSQINAPGFVSGGTLDGNIFGTGGSIGVATSPGGAIKARRSFMSEHVNGSGQTYRGAIGDVDATNDMLLGFYHSVSATNWWRWKFVNNNITMDYANGGTTRPFYITGNVTTDQFGTGAAVPYAFNPVKLMIGDFGGTIANARRIGMEAAQPAANAHGQGEIWFNRAPAAGGVFAWRCTAAGTPGTWEALTFGIVTNNITFNNGGAGGASGQTFNGSAAVTISYNSIGAAPLASPALTGTPTGPTAAAGTNTTQLATTAFVRGELNADVPAVSTVNTSFTAATADNKTHKVASGAGQTLTLNNTAATGTSFTIRFTTAWSVTCASLSKNGATPAANGSIAAGNVVTFLHEGAGTWVISGGGIT